jgi:nucleoside 2-deoxyribosyltransferase
VKVYIIGSLRNPDVPKFANRLRAAGITNVFDDWYAAGPEADDYWQQYERNRGHTFVQALAGKAAEHVYEFDQTNLLSSDAVVLLMPAGKSGHLEAGYCAGKGIPTFCLMDKEPDRFDVMYRFFEGVFTKEEDLTKHLLELQQDVDNGHTDGF